MSGDNGTAPLGDCDVCHKAYPTGLLNGLTLTTQGVIRQLLVCPICARTLRNVSLGLPTDTPFVEDLAQALYDEAVKYRREKGDVIW